MDDPTISSLSAGSSGDLEVLVEDGYLLQVVPEWERAGASRP